MFEDATKPEFPQTRAQTIRLLALATRDEIERCFSQLNPPAHRLIRKPEAGRLMARGRIGGSGALFNAGEIAVARCMVLCAEHEGLAYRLGTDTQCAERSAILEALARHPAYQATIETQLLAPVAARLKAEDEARRKRVAASRVEFFTLVRGED